MEKKPEFIIGIDVSGDTPDVHSNERNEHIVIKNGTEGFRMLTKWCKSLEINLKEAVLVMENTGGYEYKLLQFCHSKNICFIRTSGLEIKKSLGIIRGKTDRVDSKRIAQYADEKYKSPELSKPLDERFLKLKSLLKYRKRCVGEAAGYKATLKERQHMYPDLKNDPILKDCRIKIAMNQKSVKAVEAEIEVVIKSDKDMDFNFGLLMSIKGIVKVNARMTIAFTENFTSFPDARTYGVYAGVVPFDYSSGTSIHRRKKVGRIANIWIKSELNQAAKSAIMYDEELKAYAEKKLKTKPYSLVLNNIKFKLILRMFAVVKRGTKYVDNYKNAA